MNTFTAAQKDRLLSLAKRYDAKVYDIASRTSPTEIILLSQEEAAMFEAFSSKICDLVLKDYPDYEGADEGIHADAEMVTFMIADILSNSGFSVD